MLTKRVEHWRDGGTFLEVGGHQIFVREQRPPAGVEAASALPLVLLHGYPSSSYDWREIFELLPDHHLLAFDFLGFGLSDKPGTEPYSLKRQADLAEAIVARVLGDSAILLVAHDMATSVTTELLAREVEGKGKLALRAVLLFNGSMVLERASLTLSQRILRSRLGPLFARITFAGLFRKQFARIFSPSHPLTREQAEDAWALLAHHGGNRVLHLLTFYLHERIRFRDRWLGALGAFAGPLEVAWALRDPVCTGAVLAAVRECRPGVPVREFPLLGHYPQLEDPGAVAEVVRDFAARSS